MGFIYEKSGIWDIGIPDCRPLLRVYPYIPNSALAITYTCKFARAAIGRETHANLNLMWFCVADFFREFSTGPLGFQEFVVIIAKPQPQVSVLRIETNRSEFENCAFGRFKKETETNAHMMKSANTSISLMRSLQNFISIIKLTTTGISYLV